MRKRNKGRTKRIRNLVIVCALSAIILTVSTYAWFIGMRTVNMSSFDVEIASTDSLALSLDGEVWSSTVSISRDTMDSASYEENTNNWGGEGLLPMSSVGAMDTGASRMMLYEKASLTPTPGGYRLLASRVHNYEQDKPEQDGYVVFDLFIKNYSGAQYLTELNPADEEAIYLTTNSEVTVAESGVENTGIENSVRVAFAQIGRVKGTITDEGKITGITCISSAEAGVTGICRTAQIWEPNDTNHVANAISWYDTSCIKRVGADVTKTASYSGACGSVTDGIAYKTYAVAADIAASDNVDIYDGADYNTRTPNSNLIQAYPYFTDTMKLLTGTKRPTFMTLAPNSITKVRIYIYIEGQDVDNYDFASIGKKISVKFGFTKERLTEDDIDYNQNGGPDINEGDGPNAADLTVPVITTLGANPLEIVKDAAFADPGAAAIDNKDGDITGEITASGTVNTGKIGSYKVVYTVVDAAGNTGVKTRIVNVVATATKPVITITGDKYVIVTKGTAYNDAGATAVDAAGEALVGLTSSGTVDVDKVGHYRITYTVSDEDETTTAVRVVSVVEEEEEGGGD